MTMFRQIGWTEIILIGGFILAYFLYLLKVIKISRTLGTPFGMMTIKLVVRTLCFILLLVAILGPTFGDARREVKSVGKDIMICVDLSKSMDAFDVPPTRLEKIKFEMKRIIAAFNSDRIGIVIFSSEAFMQCPLTYDQNALNLFIETMNTGLVPGSGTDFGPPLRMALNKMDEENQTGVNQKSKVIVLISDGEDFGEDTKEMAKEVEDQEIKLYTLGVGTEQGSQIQTTNGYKMDREGNTVISKLNSASLKNLADQTDGQYFEINDTRNDVNKLISSINKIEGQMRDARFVDVSANQYFFFLLAALGLLVIDVLISIKTIQI